MRFFIGQWVAVSLIVLIAYSIWDNFVNNLNLIFPFKIIILAILSYFTIQIILLCLYWLCIGVFMRKKEGNIIGLDLMWWGIGVMCYDIALTLTTKIFYHRVIPIPFLKLYGFKCGKSCSIAIGTEIVDPNMITFGNNCRTGFQALVSGHIIEGKYLKRDKVIVGNNVEIGSRAIVAPGAIIQDNVVIGVQSFVPKGKVIESNGIYVGTPVRKIKDLPTDNSKILKDET